MKTKFTQQEILLITGSNFSSRECSDENIADKSKLSASEQLADACWNGLLDQMLPELVERTADGKKLLLWNIKEYNSFLELELCESNTKSDPVFSIDPYRFLPVIVDN
ncbi:MAG: hypothetical protein H0W12_06890 [Chitinophagaceae bacterium]|nr:hypothetical protein [Chitinophagaceae bacterium]